MRAETRSVPQDLGDARVVLLGNAVGIRSSCLLVNEGFGVKQGLELGFVGGGNGRRVEFGFKEVSDSPRVNNVMH